jgi:hypothetical protein
LDEPASPQFVDLELPKEAKMTSKATLLMSVLVLALSACSLRGPSPSTPEPNQTPTSAQFTPSPTPSSSTLDSSPAGYLGSGPSGVEFIQWTESQGRLSGQYQTLYVTEDNPLQVKNQNAAFTGILNASNMSLTFSALGFSTTWIGTLKDDTLTLVKPNQNGLLITDLLRPGTVDDYNKAAATFQQSIQQKTANAQSTQAAVSARAARQKAVADANFALASALSSLKNSVANLNQDTKFDHVLKAYATHWNTMQAHYQRMQADAAKRPFNCDQLTAVQDDRVSLQDDLVSIHDDHGSFTDEQNIVTSDTADVSNQIRSTNQALQILQAAVTANPTGIPLPQFTPADVATEVAAAERALFSSDKAVKLAQGQAATFDQDAAQLLQTANDFVAGLKCQ